MAIEERWFVLYNWNQQQWRKLKMLTRLWREFEEDSGLLAGWLIKGEQTFKKMEQSPTEETSQLAAQLKELTVRKHTFEIFISFLNLWFGMLDNVCCFPES